MICVIFPLFLSLSLARSPLVEEYHYGVLLAQLHLCATKWDAIAMGLQFKHHEIKTIKDKRGPSDIQGTYLGDMINEWIKRDPNDPGGSPRLGALKKAVNGAGYRKIAKSLTLDEDLGKCS